MRIFSTERWLAFALSLGIGAVNGAAEPAIKFNNTDFRGGLRSNQNLQPAIFVLEELLPFKNPVAREETIRFSQEEPVPKGFHWKTNHELKIERVSLYARNMNSGAETPIGSVGRPSDGNLGSGSGAGNLPGEIMNPTISTPTSTPTSRTTRQKRQGPLTPSRSVLSGNSQASSSENGQGDMIKLSLTLSIIEGNVTIDNMRNLETFNREPLYFAAEWQSLSLGIKGTTYSRWFAYVDSQDQFESIKSDMLFSSDESAHPEKVTTLPSPTTGPTSTPLSNLPSNPNSEKEEPNAGGLATGAIIGIAVACGIVGLVSIIAAIWFFLHRRRQQTTNQGGPGRPYGVERNRTEDLMAEKEASTGTDPSPHSPYSDEGILVGGPADTHHEGTSIPNGAVAPVLPQQTPRLQQPHDQSRSYTPYSDRGARSPGTHATSIAHSEDTSRAGMGSPTAGRATPHGSLAPQYAHLVEEGMTEEEIRRLEDEERQLDAAIEQAGRR